jgi:hypothetical protein
VVTPHLDTNTRDRSWRRLCAAQLQRVVKIFSDIPPNFCLAIDDKANGTNVNYEQPSRDAAVIYWEA